MSTMDEFAVDADSPNVRIAPSTESLVTTKLPDAVSAFIDILCVCSVRYIRHLRADPSFNRSFISSHSTGPALVFSGESPSALQNFLELLATKNHRLPYRHLFGTSSNPYQHDEPRLIEAHSRSDVEARRCLQAFYNAWIKNDLTWEEDENLMDQLPILIELNQTNLNELETILTDEPSYEPNKPGRKIRDATDYAFNLMPVSFADVAKRLDLSRILNLPDDHVESAHWLVHTLKTHAWWFEAVAEGRPSTTMPMNDPKWLATCSTVSEQASLRGSSTGLKPYCNRTEFRTRTARAVCGNCWRRVIESGSHFYSGGYL